MVRTSKGTDEISDNPRGRLQHGDRDSRRDEMHRTVNNIAVDKFSPTRVKRAGGEGLRVEMKDAAIEFYTRTFPRGGFAD